MYGRTVMKKLDEQVLKVTKEIVAKFIEVGRVSPTAFDETFKSVYKTVKEAILNYGFYEEEEVKKPKGQEKDKGAH